MSSDIRKYSFKTLGTVLGAIIIIAGVITIINALLYPMTFNFLFGFIYDLSAGFAAILAGALIIYAARKL